MSTQEINQVESPETAERLKDARPESNRVYRPNVDVCENNDELVLWVDMPGADAGSIEIKFEDGTLALHGRVKPRQSEDTAYLLQEYGVGDFYREFQVTEKINVAGIRAEYTDGVLKVTLPKVEAVKPRRVEVQTK
jgi:HSP20 family protein